MVLAGPLDWSQLSGPDILVGVGTLCATVLLYHLATMYREARVAPQEHETDRHKSMRESEVRVSQITSEAEIEIRRLELEHELAIRQLELDMDRYDEPPAGEPVEVGAVDLLTATELGDVVPRTQEDQS